MVMAGFGAQGLVLGRVEVVGRVEVRAVVRRRAAPAPRPALAVGQVFLLQAGKEGRDLREGVLVAEILDLGAKAGGSEMMSFSR